jgi:hypothetical protein
MAAVFPGRYTAQVEGPFVVFLIGMRVNRLFAVHKWFPVANAMPGMLKELYKSPESGFLGAQLFLNWRGVSVAQYWRSFEHLHAYAHARDARHLPAWVAFNRAGGGDGTDDSVGIWHETYAIQAGSFECIYANMPRFGLAQASEHVPVVGRTDTAKARMGAKL